MDLSNSIARLADYLYASLERSIRIIQVCLFATLSDLSSYPPVVLMHTLYMQPLTWSAI